MWRPGAGFFEAESAAYPRGGKQQEPKRDLLQKININPVCRRNPILISIWHRYHIYCQVAILKTGFLSTGTKSDALYWTHGSIVGFKTFISPYNPKFIGEGGVDAARDLVEEAKEEILANYERVSAMSIPNGSVRYIVPACRTTTA